MEGRTCHCAGIREPPECHSLHLFAKESQEHAKHRCRCDGGEAGEAGDQWRARRPDRSRPQVLPATPALPRGTPTRQRLSDDLSRGKQIRKVNEAPGGGRWGGVIATSIEEGRVQEGNKLDRGGSIPPSIRDPSLGITWELPGAERGVQVDGSLAPHRLPHLNVGFLSLNLCEMWRGILKQTTLHSFCLHCFFLPIFFYLHWDYRKEMKISAVTRNALPSQCSPRVSLMQWYW